MDTSVANQTGTESQDFAAEEGHGAEANTPYVTTDDLIAEGWVSPDRVAELEATIAQLIEGRYLEVPKPTDRLSESLRKLAGTLGREASKNLRRMVHLSMTTNDGVVAAVEMSRGVKEATHRSQTIAAASEELVASVNDIAENSTTVAEEAEEARNTVNDGQTAANQAVEKMESILSAVDEAASRVGKLSDSSQEIGSILGMIEDIAFQTNMLALNASVEAARAGDAGKGFAVVANEVKSLAEQTKSATVNIGERVSELQDEMKGIIKSMESVSSIVEEGSGAIRATGENIGSVASRIDQVTLRMQEIANILAQQKTATSEVAEGVGVIAEMNQMTGSQIENTLDVLDDSSDTIIESLDLLAKLALPKLVIHLAKSDHVIWKKKLAAMLLGRAQLNPDELADHHTCRLGKWYDNVDDPALLENPAFQQLVDPHRDVHAAGIEAVKLYNAGNLEGALVELRKVHESSQSVLQLLHALAP